MTKICGLVDTTASKRMIEEYLQSMVKVMKHDLEAPEEYFYFEGGGIAVIGNSSLEEKRSARDGERGSYLALCGRIVGFKGNEAPPPRYEEYDVSTEGGVDSLLRAFQEYGEDILEKLNGVFAFAHHDPVTNSLTVVNDRYGFMPLYYYYKEGKFLFSSEVKAILQILGPQEFDWESFADFFYIGQMTAQKTLFKDVCALDSGQTLTYLNGRLSKRQYYDFTKTPVLNPGKVSTEKVATLFTEAVRRRIKHNKPNTALLSGGFDSRLILGALLKLGVVPDVLTLEHARERSGTDSRFAALLTERLDLRSDLRPTREDFFFSSYGLETFYIQDGMLPTWEAFAMEIYPELDSSMGAVWDGLALDVALGSSRQREAGKENAAKNLKQFAGGRGRQQAIPSRSVNCFLLALVLSPRYFRLVNRGFMRRLRDELAKIPESENQFQNFLLKHRTRRRVAITPHQLFSAKVEPITPASDADFMDYVLAITQEAKHNHKLYIDIFRRHFPTLTEVPVSSGGFEFYFDSDEMKKRRPATVYLKRRLARAWLYFKASTSSWVSRKRGLEHSSAATAAASRLTRLPPELVIHVVDKKNFNRHFYNKRLLRRLFAAYRNGHLIYHELFKIVFYIELWHLLFVDQDSSLLFNPRNLDRHKEHRAE